MTEINFKKIRAATVFLRNIPVGTLKKENENLYLFQYLQQYISSPQPIAIARSLPLQQEPIACKKLHPFFDNLIAEGWLLECAEKILHIDKNNRFILLMATGNSTIGAVSVTPMEENGIFIPVTNTFKNEKDKETLKLYPNLPLVKFSYCPTCFTPLKENKIHRKCAIEMWGTARDIKVELDEKNPLQSFAQIIYGGSISGAQKKGMFYLDKKKGILTSTSINAQYILKPDGNYPELPENEHVTMAIAKKVGFNIPPFTILKIEKFGHIFAIKRFDRTEDNSPLMMEDMVQIIQEQSEDKYNSNYERVAKAIQKYSSAPVVDLTDFFRRILFCYIVANGDMHLKNWSLLENKNALGTFILSPCYDLLNTRVPIPQEKMDIALSMLGKEKNLKKSYFIEFASYMHLPSAQVDKIFNEIPLWKKVINEMVPISLLSQEAKNNYLDIVHMRCSKI